MGDWLDEFVKGKPMPVPEQPERMRAIESVMAYAEVEMLELDDELSPRDDGLARMSGTKKELRAIATGEKTLPRRIRKKRVPDAPVVTKEGQYPLDSPCRKCAQATVHAGHLLGCQDDMITEARFEEYSFKGDCPRWLANHEKKARKSAGAQPKQGATLFARSTQEDGRPSVIDEQPWFRRAPTNFPNVETYVGKWSQSEDTDLLIEYARTPYGLSRLKQLEKVLEKPVDAPSPSASEKDEARLAARVEVVNEARAFRSFSHDKATAHCPVKGQDFKVEKLSVLGKGVLVIYCPLCGEEHCARIGGDSQCS